MATTSQNGRHFYDFDVGKKQYYFVFAFKLNKHVTKEIIYNLVYY